jgi:tetratricopeptide (TPR) repeat protein
LANALRISGECRAAFLALERADAIAERTLTPEFHRLLVAYARAAILYEMRRNDEALLLLDHCAREFDAMNDPERARDAREFMGSVWHAEGEYGFAITAWTDALRIAEGVHDEERVAILHGNIGHAYARLREDDLARDSLARALVGYRRLNMPVQKARMLQTLGRLELRRTGRDDMLLEAAAEFARLGMPGDEIETRAARIVEWAALNDEKAVLLVLAECRDLMQEAMRRDMDGVVAPLANLVRAVERGPLTGDMADSFCQSIMASSFSSNDLPASGRLN